MDPAAAAAQALVDTDDYLLFDPRAGRATRPTAGRSRQTFNEAIVFVVGGGSYVEFTNLGEYAMRNTGGGSGGAAGAMGKKIIYGSTEIISPGEFLEMLGSLAV